jgi:polyvinyl alcohol dehydrogenase (cytochrome)
MSTGGLTMKAIRGRLAVTIFALVSALCAASPIGARAQESVAGRCADAGTTFADPLNAPHWNGWGVGPEQHRFQPAEMAQLIAGDVPRLKLKWAFGFPGAKRAIAQPTVVGGRVFIGGGQRGKVYSLDANSGCTYWQFDADAGVRTAMVIGQTGDGWSAYFGDQRANVYAVDALTGTVRWKTRIDDYRSALVTGAPTLVGTTLFVPVSSYEELTGANAQYPCCSFRGSVVALEAATGKVLWKSYTIEQEPTPRAINTSGIQLMGPSGAAVWSSPTFDAVNRMVYVTTGDNYSDPPTDTSDAIVAFSAESGKLAWSRQTTSGDAYNIACVMAPAGVNCPQAKGPDVDFGSSAILVDLPDRKRALIGTQKSGVVTAVDPDHAGEILWQRRVGRGGSLGGVEWGAAADASKLYVAVSDVKLSVVAAGTPGGQTSVLNPNVTLLLDGKVGGGLHALKLDTGEEVWQTAHPGCNDVPGCSPAQSAAVTAIPGVVFSGGLDGHLRAYAAEDGRIVWDVDTKGEHQTVNGVAGGGGSIDGAGPVVVGGILYVNSGSGIFGSMPGNVLLAYSVEGH